MRIFQDRPITDEDVARYREDGFIVFESIMTDEARSHFIDFIDQSPEVQDLLNGTRPLTHKKPFHGSTRNPLLNDPVTERMVDDPFLVEVLSRTIGEFRFDHAGCTLHRPGSKGFAWHHDCYWGPGQRNAYVGFLTYLDGFRRGDGSLSVVRGSHRVQNPDPQARGAKDWRDLTGGWMERTGVQLEEVHLELPAGSVVFHNTWNYHSVSPKPAGSAPRHYMYIGYRQPGGLFPASMTLDEAFLNRQSPERRKLFERD